MMKYTIILMFFFQFSFSQSSYTIKCESGQITIGVTEDLIKITGNYNTSLKYDGQNRLISFSNIAVEYDYKGRVSKVGKLSISYFNNKISTVGGLVFNYEENGTFIDTTGNLDCSQIE